MITAADQKIRIEKPTVADGLECWRLADESNVLDVNSKYAYLLWCRDFAATSVVARRSDNGGDGEAVVGFVTGFRRPESPNVLLVWQVAVDSSARGQGLAVRMLDTLFHQVAGVDRMETTITPDNKASIALFTAFAERNGAPIERSELFGPDLLGADHQPEHLYRIGPIGSGS